MLKSASTLITVLLFAFTSVGAAQWTTDKPHSSVGFSVKHLVVSTVKGYFGDYSADIQFDPDQLESGSVVFTVQVGSIDTDDAKRDEHLRSDDFFNAEKFPTMTFKSTKVHSVSANQFKIIGDLTIRGITREVTFDCEFHGVIDDPWGNTKAGFTASTKIDRQDFDVKWNKTLDAGGVLVGNEVTITIELELGMVK